MKGMKPEFYIIFWAVIMGVCILVGGGILWELHQIVRLLSGK